MVFFFGPQGLFAFRREAIDKFEFYKRIRELAELRIKGLPSMAPWYEWTMRGEPSPASLYDSYAIFMQVSPSYVTALKIEYKIDMDLFFLVARQMIVVSNLHNSYLEMGLPENMS